MARITITGAQIRERTLNYLHLGESAAIRETQLQDSGLFLRTDNTRNWSADQSAGNGTTNYKLTNLADGSARSDAATVGQLEDFAAGLVPIDAVRAATTGNITLEDEQTIDGVAVVAGDRVLVRAQSNPVDNGVYVVVDEGAWTRAVDLDGTPEHEVRGGVYVFITEGTTYKSAGFVVVASGNVAVGTDPFVWTQFSGAALFSTGNGLIQTAGVMSVDAGDGFAFSDNKLNLVLGDALAINGVSKAVEVKVDDNLLGIRSNAVALKATTAANIIVADDEGEFQAVAMSGDVTISDSGATTIGAEKVTNSMLAGSIAVGKLSLAENAIIIGDDEGEGVAGLSFVPNASLDWDTVTATNVVSALAIKGYVDDQLANAATFVDQEVVVFASTEAGVEPWTATLADEAVVSSIKLFLNGQRLVAGAGKDFQAATDAGTTTVTLEWLDAIEGGDVFVVEYRKAL